MSWVSGLLVYLVLWWLTLFVVLPFGVRTPADLGQQPEAGHASSAPVQPRLWQKFLITTVIALVLFAGFWLMHRYDPLGIGPYIRGY